MTSPENTELEETKLQEAIRLVGPFNFYYRKGVAHIGDDYLDAVDELLKAATRTAELEKALRWYEMEVAAVAKNIKKDPDIILASLTVLSLDGGQRARDVIGDKS